MLNENIKSFRKKKGLSQEELAIKLNVVRQTVSKWELGLSVPDAEMLIKLADVLETSINTLLGETNQTEPDITSIEEIGISYHTIDNSSVFRGSELYSGMFCVSVCGCFGKCGNN